MANRPSMNAEKTSFISLALASALSALLVVGVYEIRSRLAKGHSVSSEPTPQPERQDPTEDETAVPRTQPGEGCNALRDRYVLRCLADQTVPGGRPALAPGASAVSMSPDNEANEMAETTAWLHPPKTELADMAKRCEIRLISPAILEKQVPTVDDEHAQALSLSAKERADLDQTLREMHQSFADAVRKTFADGATDPSKESRLSVEQMIDEIQERPNSGFSEARQRMAAERAGAATPPATGADLPPGERIFRLSAGLGDDFERHLADRVGAERARQLVYSPLAGPWTNRSAQSGCPVRQ
jgi:flagellar motor protein MotB